MHIFPHAGVKKMWRFLSLGAAICIVVGCGSSTEPKGAAGTYMMTAWDGHVLPFKWDSSPVQEDWITPGSSLVLRADGFYVMAIRDSSYCYSCGGTPQAPAPRAFIDVGTRGGSWSLNGSALTLTDTGNGGSFVQTASVSGGVIQFTGGTRFER